MATKTAVTPRWPRQRAWSPGGESEVVEVGRGTPAVLPHLVGVPPECSTGRGGGEIRLPRIERTYVAYTRPDHEAWARVLARRLVRGIDLILRDSKGFARFSFCSRFMLVLLFRV